VRAAAVLFSGVLAYKAVRQDACSDDERERREKARVERTGHVVTCRRIPMWRMLREMEKFSGAGPDAATVADRFHGIGGQRDVNGGDRGSGAGDSASRAKRPALQLRQYTGFKAAERMRNNKYDMRKSAVVDGVELVRSRKTMEATVPEFSKRTLLESKRAAVAFFTLAENKGTDEAKKFFKAMRKHTCNICIAAINITAPAAVARGAVKVRGASPSRTSATAAGASVTAAASAAASAGGGKVPVIASSDASDATTNVAEASRLDKRVCVARVRLARGRNAMAAKSQVGQARIEKNQAANDLTGPEVAAGSSVRAPTARGDMRSLGAGRTVRTTGALSAGTGGVVNKEVNDHEEDE